MRYYFNLALTAIKVIKNEGWHSFFLKARFHLSNRLKRTGLDSKVRNILFWGRSSEPRNVYKKYYEQALSFTSTKYGNEFVQLKDGENKPSHGGVKLIAFYLPQYHPIPENDLWWGKGFTEWTNVTRAVPQFLGHYQPRLPGELGFYDLRIPDVQKRQIELAKQHGLYGFCFHFYWFNGKRLLENPLEQFLSNPANDFHFCINWANENWTRRWDGQEKDVLIGQCYSYEDDIEFIKYVSKYLMNNKYIRINNKPLLIVYRPELLPDAKLTSENWRKWCRENGIGEIYLGLTQSFQNTDPREIGFDAAIEFAPNSFQLRDITSQFQFLNTKFQGRIFDYDSALEIARKQINPDYKKFRGLCPGWDNDARRPGQSTVLANSSPESYKEWLKIICDFTVNNFEPEERLVFVNAWNEWAEGAYLEPDRKYGYAYLAATADVLNNISKTLLKQTNEGKALQIFSRPIIKRSKTAVILHLYYTELWGEFAQYLANLDNDFDLFVSIPKTIYFNEETIYQQYPNAYIYRCENMGRDVAPFLKVFTQVFSFKYDYICKMHTKKSLHRKDGNKWRKDICLKLVGSKNNVIQIKRKLDEKNVGVVGPAGHVLNSKYFLGENVSKLNNLCTEACLKAGNLQFPFVAGSMFWFKPNSLRILLSLDIDAMSLEYVDDQTDGTLAHAFERFFGLAVIKSGYVISEIDEKGKIDNIDVKTLPKKYPYAKATQGDSFMS